MKKLFLIIPVFIFFFIFSQIGLGQTTINFDDNSKWTAGSVALTGYATNHKYTDGSFSATGGNALRNTTATQDGYAGALGTFSWRLKDETVDWRITISSGGISTFSLKIRRWDNNPDPAFTLDYSTNGGTNWINVANINNTSLNNSSDWKLFDGTINSPNNNILIRLYSSSTTERIMIDDFTWSQYTTFTAPTTQASNITFSSVSPTQLTANWTSGDGAKRIAIINTANSFTNPTDGQVNPSANTSYSGSGEQVIYNNTGNNVSVTGLSPNNTYWVRVYEYNGTGSGSKYLTTVGTNNPNSQLTPFPVPSTQASLITFSNVQQKQLTIGWNNGNGTNRAVFIKELAGTITNPINGTTYTASTDWNTKGTQLGTSGYYCVYNSTGNTVTVTNLQSGTLYVVQIFEYNGSGSTSVYNVSTATDNPNSQATVSDSPLLTVNPGTLSGFSTDAGTVSSSQSYTLSGSSLSPDGNITITAPTNFEVSLDDVSFSGSVNVPYTGDILSPTTIYTRIATTSSTGNVSGNLVNSGGGATSVNVSVSGFVYSTQPTLQPTNLAFSNVTGTAFDISWTAGNGTNTIVLIKSGSAVNSNPVKGTSYTANTVFGSGTQIGTGNYVVYNSTGTSVSVTGLTGGTPYYVALYSFNGATGTENYLTTSPLTGNQTTDVSYITWLGTAGDGLWGTASNWSTGIVPSTNDYVLLDNSTVAGTYTVTLPSGTTTTTIKRLIITPATGNNITLLLPVTNTVSPGFTVNDGVSATDDIILNDGAILKNSSGAGSNDPISVSKMKINKGGKYTHNTSRSATAMVTSLSLDNALTTEYGEFEYDTPGTSSTAITASGRTYGSLTLSRSSGSGTYTSSGTGTFMVKGNFKINSNVTYTTSLTGDMYIRGDLINDGADINITTHNFVYFNGAFKQYITGTGGISLGKLTIGSDSGVYLSKNINVSSQLNLIYGKLILNDYDLTLASGTTIGLNQGYVYTNGAGKLVIKNIGSTESLFPLGTDNGYSPVWITNTGTAGDYSINVKPDNSGTNNGDDRVKLKWDISGPSSGSNTKIKIGWMTSQEGTNFTNNRSSYAKLYHLSGSSWMSAGNGENILTPNDGNVDFTLYSTGISTFSPFATGLNDGALPIHLSSLNSTVAGRNIKLNWVTESEINNSGFDVERKLSADNSQWKKITFINGNGTKNTPTNYSYTDFNLQSGKYEYRLKQIDNNGNYEYFALNGAIEVGVPSKFDLSQNYPNPFNPITKINFDLAKDTKVDIRIFDMLGREVKTLVNENHKAGYYTVDFNAGNLTSGVYFYRMITSDFTSVKRMVLLK